jgi:hypothetical protein
MARSVIVLLLWAGSSLAAQAPADTGRRASRLFDATEPLSITLTANFGAVGRDRDTVDSRKKPHPAILTVTGPSGDTVTLHVNLKTRGHYRLATCGYPPLKIEFDKDSIAGSVFAHEGNLKLVGQCRGGQSWMNYLLEEYLLYRVYQLVTPMSFRVRLAHVTYADSAGKKAPDIRYAFFLEDDSRLARRNHTKLLEVKGLNQGQLDSAQMGVVGTFEYMIGNTDWSVGALHNIVLVQDSASFATYPVPYDFDWSGVIWAPYANPDSRLPIHTVRERLYRSYCRTPAELAPSFAAFNAVKDSIYALYRGQADLEPKRVKQALDYYDEFYVTINDPRKARRAFIDGCVTG